MATLLNPFLRALDANGDPVSGAKLAIFRAGTTTPVTTYSDPVLATAQTRPLVANSAGEFEQAFAADGSYKFRVSDAADNLLYENDDVRMADRPDIAPYFGGYNALEADDVMSYTAGAGLEVVTEGQYIIAGYFRFKVAASGATDHHVTTAGGVNLYIVPSIGGVVTLPLFGAIGNGTTNDTAALKAGIEYVAANGGKLLGDPNHTYLVQGITSCDCTGAKAFSIDMNGAKVLYQNAATKFSIEGATQKAAALAGISATRGAPLVAVTSATGVEKGDMIIITNPAPSSGAVETRHAYTVDEVDGNNIYIDGIVQADINAQQVTDSGVGGAISGITLSLSPSILVKNWFAVIAGEETLIDQCLLVRGFSDLTFEKCILSGHTRNGFYAQRCSRVRWTAGWLAEMGYLDKNESYSLSASSAPSGTGTSFGYGFITADCSFVTVDSAMAGQGWHAVDFAIGTMVAVVNGGIYGRNALALSMHESSWHVTLQNVVIVGGEVGGGGRAAYVHYRNCTFDIDLDKNGVNGLVGSWDVTFEGCTFNGQLPETSTVSSFINSTSAGAEPGHGMRSVGYRRRFHVLNNRFNGRKAVALGFNNTAFTLDTEVIIRGNHFYKPSGVTVWAGDTTLIEGNSLIIDTTTQRFDVQKVRAGADIFIRRNSFDNLGTSGAGAIRLHGDGGCNQVHLIGNTSSGYGALFDFTLTNATTINSIIGNVGRGAAFLSYASPADIHTADAVVNNVWDGTLISFSSDLIVTTASQNVAV